MIISFRDKETAAFAAGRRVKAFSGIERAARLKLDLLESALTLSYLAVLPGNRFEALKGSGKANTASALTTSGVFASNGQNAPPVRRMLKLSIATRSRLSVGKERTCHCSRSIPENIWPRN